MKLCVCILTDDTINERRKDSRKKSLMIMNNFLWLFERLFECITVWTTLPKQSNNKTKILEIFWLHCLQLLLSLCVALGVVVATKNIMTLLVWQQRSLGHLSLWAWAWTWCQDQKRWTGSLVDKLWLMTQGGGPVKRPAVQQHTCRTAMPLEWLSWLFGKRQTQGCDAAASVLPNI